MYRKGLKPEDESKVDTAEFVEPTEAVKAEAELAVEEQAEEG